MIIQDWAQGLRLFFKHGDGSLHQKGTAIMYGLRVRLVQGRFGLLYKRLPAGRIF